MANHRGAAALLVIASSSLLLVAVALSGGADARPTVRPEKTAALHGADVMRTAGNTVVTVRHDANIGPGYVAVAAAQGVAEPECDGDEAPEEKQPKHHGEEPTKQPGEPGYNWETKKQPGQPGEGDDGGDSPPTGGGDDGDSLQNSEDLEMDQELCSDCEEPKTKEPPPCDTCEPEPELTCNEVHAVREGETCDSVVQCAGLDQDDFLRFNPNLCCDKLFVGQWVCLDATCAA